MNKEKIRKILDDKQSNQEYDRRILQKRINEFFVNSFMNNTTTKSISENICENKTTINESNIQNYTLTNLSYHTKPNTIQKVSESIIEKEL